MKLKVCRLAAVLAGLFILISLVQSLSVQVDGNEVVKQLLDLAKYSEVENPAVTRILFTPQDQDARRFVKDLMTATGLAVREDAMGNIFGRLEGTQAHGAVMSGSHCDAIPLAGMYDGTVGVIGAIAALAALKAAGFKPCRPIDAMMFTSEEPTRFGLSCLGSRGLAGALTADLLDKKLDVNGSSFLEAAAAAGYESKSHQDILDRTMMSANDIAYFVELHIEQGPLLEADGMDIGVVTAIAAPAALRVTFSGDGGHAGAQLMPYRNDAGLAAAELALEVEKAALATGAIDTVATTGLWEIHPNAVNSVPREAKLEIDVRDIDMHRRDGIVKTIIDAAKEIATRRKVRFTTEIINQDPPATCGKQVQQAILNSVKQLGLSHQSMVSRAYHDSLFMAQLAPTSMIFIPCRGGFSHRPDEFASPQHIEAGIKVLALTLAELSCSGGADKSEL